MEVTLRQLFALQVGRAEVSQDRDETGYQDHRHRNWQDGGQVVDWTVWTLTATTHFTDVQQVCVQRVKDGLVETLCNIHKGSVISKYMLKADSHIACRAHAVPLPCRAAKGLEYVFPI